MWTTFGIEPETLDYTTMKVVAPGYQLRPEIIESAYYLAFYTKDDRYQEMGPLFCWAWSATARQTPDMPR